VVLKKYPVGEPVLVEENAGGFEKILSTPSFCKSEELER
jgi:hypothetical protein